MLGPMETLPESALLTAADERQLAQAIEVGVLAEHLLSTGLRPVAATEAELRFLASEGRRSWQQFLMANLRLVWMFAGREARRTGLNVEELFQEGCVALAGALQRFDSDRGRFSTYAVTRIQQQLAEAGATRFGDLCLPPSRALRLRRVHGLRSQLCQERGTQIDVKELSAELQRPTEWTRRILGYRAPIPIDTCASAWQLAAAEADPDQALLSRQVLQKMMLIPHDQAVVLRLRYGLDDGEPASQAEVAERLQLSQSTVRRLEQRGLAALRAVLGHATDVANSLAG